MSKTKSILLLITLFLSNLIICQGFIFSPTINLVFQMFPDATGIANFIISGTYLIIFIACPVAGILCDKVTTKFVFVIGSIAAAVGGSLLLFFENPLWMAAMRSLVAIGYGFVQTSCVSLIAQVYVDEKKRASIMGYYNGTMSVLGAVLSIVAGNLAANSIQACYKLYLLFIPVAIFAILFVPSIKNSMKESKDKEEAAAEITEEVVNTTQKGMGGTYWIHIIMYFLYNFAYSVPFFYITVYIADNALGTPALAGTLNSVCTVISFLMAMVFAKIVSALGKNVLTATFGISIIAAGALLFFPSVASTFISFGLFGAAYFIIFTYVFTYLPNLVPANKRSTAVSFVGASSNLAAFATTYAISAIIAITGWNSTEIMMAPFALLIILTVVEVFASRGLKKISVK